MSGRQISLNSSILADGQEPYFTDEQTEAYWLNGLLGVTLLANEWAAIPNPPLTAFNFFLHSLLEISSKI